MSENVQSHPCSTMPPPVHLRTDGKEGILSLTAARDCE